MAQVCWNLITERIAVPKGRLRVPQWEGACAG